MYEITVDRTFCAAHAIVIAGEREPVHGHNWHVRATIVGEELDGDGLLCDFHAVDHWLAQVCEPMTNQNLNEVAPFDTLNPTAEHVARHIAKELNGCLRRALGHGVRVASVRVTEAEGCSATFRLTGGS